MKEKNNKINKLRFKDENGEYFGEWEEKKIGDICQKQSSNISANTLEDNNGEYKLYGASGIFKNINFFTEKEPYLAIVKDGAGVGRILNCEGNSSVLGTLDIIKPNNGTNLYFLFLLFQKINFKVYTVGSTIPHIYFKDYSSKKILFPSIQEQQKIADFLSSIDIELTLLKKEKKSVEEYKKGMMQKIFSQELRFKDENGEYFGEWEEKELGEIAEIKAGTSKVKYINSKGTKILIDMGAIGESGNIIPKKKIIGVNEFLNKGDLVMVKDDIGGGNIIGKVIYIDSENKYVLGDHVYRIKIKKGYSKFIYFIINSYKINKSFRRKANGTAQIGINNKTVFNQVIPLPPIQEQQKIADFLSSIDKELELIDKKIERVESLKKGTMQRLFN